MPLFRISPRLVAVVIVGLSLSPAWRARAWGQALPPQEEVSEGLRELETWLPAGKIRRGWRAFLRGDELEQQIRGDAPPDRGLLGRILERYRSRHDGLDMKRFVRVRSALERWLGQLEGPPLEQLPTLVEQAQQQLRRYDAGDVESAREALRAAYARLEAYMVRGSAVHQAWRPLLLSAELEGQMAPGAPLDLATLEQVADRYYGGDPALVLPRFREVRDRLEELLARARIAQDANVERSYATVLTALNDRLRNLDQRAEDRDRRLGVIGRAVHWLQSRSQTPELVVGLRQRFVQPNLYLYVGSEVVSSGGRIEVDRVMPVRDVILGTCIRGTGHTIGITRFELVPDSQRAVLDLMFDGRTLSRTLGVNGPARIRTRGTTYINASKRLYVDETGIREGRTVASARTRTQITGVSTTFRGLFGRIAQRVASRQVARKKSQAEAIGSRHAERLFVRQFDAEAQPRVDDGNQMLVERFRLPLAERRLLPELHFHTTRERLYVSALEAAPGRLAASSPPPRLADPGSIGLRIHESLLNNFAFGAVAGQTVTNEELESTLIELLGSLPEGLESEPGERWSITFDPERPLTVRFDDAGMVITMRGTRYTRNNEEYQGMNVTARYAIDGQEESLRLVRLGELEILPPNYMPGSRALGLRQTTLRNLLKRRFNQIFKPEFQLEGFALPGGWAKAGALVATESISQGGWLSLAWRVDPRRAPTNTVTRRGTFPATEGASDVAAR